jgi:pilus assembly protein CpaB
MRPKSIILLVVALGCGLVASIGINQMLSAKHTEPAETGPKSTVFVAKAKIGIGDTIKHEQINLIEYPAEHVPQGAITELKDIEGRRAKTTILPGLPIVEGQLLAIGENGEDVTKLIPVGMRGFPVRVDAVSGLAGLVKPGDRVDVVVHIRENPSLGLTSPKTVTFLQNLKVFAVDDVFNRNNDGQQAVVAKTISLLVTQNQANMLTMATELGTIRLSMRGAGDDTVEQVEGVDARNLFGTPAPTPTPTPQMPPELSHILPPTVQPTPVEPQPVATETPRDIYVMRIFDGAVPRDVRFEDGKPVDLSTMNSNNPVASPNNTPPVAPSKP